MKSRGWGVLPVISVANTTHPCAALLNSLGVKGEVCGLSFPYTFMRLTRPTVLLPRREMSRDVESPGTSRSCHSPTLLHQLLTISEVASPQGRQDPADHFTRSSSSDTAGCGGGSTLALGRCPMTTAISFVLREYLLLAAD